jgi:hypothetical protein
VLQSVSKLGGFASHFTIILSCFLHIAVVLEEERCSALARQDKYLAHDSKTFGAAACSSGGHRPRLTVRTLEMPEEPYCAA